MATIADTFNRSNESLDTSTASGGGTWAGFGDEGGSDWEVLSNEAHVDYRGDFDNYYVRLDGVDFDGDDHEVEATVAAVTQSGSYLWTGPLARKEDNSTATFYAYRFQVQTGATNLVRRVAGSLTVLDTGAGGGGAADNLRVRCDGDNVYGYLNDTEDCQVDDSGTISGSTYIQGGMAAEFGNNATIDVTWDDFAGTDLAVDYSITADAAVEKAQSGSVTANAAIQAAQTGSITANAAIERTETGSVTADAAILAAQAASVTADAAIQASQAASVTANGAIQRTFSGSVTADATIIVTVVDSVTADAAIFAAQIDSVTSDATIQAAQAASITADATIASANQRIHDYVKQPPTVFFPRSSM
jgi:hypothetical protein